MPKIVDHEEQRRQLSATVAQVVAQLGLENTTLRKVAAHHGCTKGMVQHYFVDKEELLLAALTYVEDCCSRRMCEPAMLAGLNLLQAQLSAQLPLKPPIIQEWQVRLAFNSRAVISQDMRLVLSQCQTRQSEAGMHCLRAARKSGELRSGLNLRNSYRALTALVFGMGVGAVMDPVQLAPATQRQILKTAIDGLRS
jgi:TetR/AcrR family transcriptional repressor of bet genes